MNRNQGGGPAAAPAVQSITCRVEIGPDSDFTTEVVFEGSLPRDVVSAALVEMAHAIATTHRRVVGLGDSSIERLEID